MYEDRSLDSKHSYKYSEHEIVCMIPALRNWGYTQELGITQTNWSLKLSKLQVYWTVDSVNKVERE